MTSAGVATFRGVRSRPDGLRTKVTIDFFRYGLFGHQWIIEARGEEGRSMSCGGTEDLRRAITEAPGTSSTRARPPPPTFQPSGQQAWLLLARELEEETEGTAGKSERVYAAGR